jgi:DNA polymerase III subunit gamma/tau
MTGQSLYRKWRSQTFAELVGQEHVVQTLRNALRENRIGHAYLFTGPRGVGKTTMARLLAKAVNCLDNDAGRRPCGDCVMCTSIAEGRAVDVIEMDAASHTSVEDAREIIERVQFRPNEARYKVYIIDETHMLSTAAFNALLKTLEEPPEHAIFILATTEVHKVPATILSRCQRFTFSRHTTQATAQHLQHVAREEGLELTDAAATAIARSATGSMRDALGVLEQLASFSSGTIDAEQVQRLLGMSAAAEVDALIEGLVAQDMAAALRAVAGIADQGADLRQFTRDLVERLRGLMLLRAAQDETLLDGSDSEMAQLQQWAGRAEVAQVLHWIKIYAALDTTLRQTAFGALPLELATVEALLPPPAVVSAAAAARPTVAARPAAGTPRAAPAVSREVPAAARAEVTGDPPLRIERRPAVEPAGDPPLPRSEYKAPTADAGAAEAVRAERKAAGDPPPPDPKVWAAQHQAAAPQASAAALAADSDFSLLERVEAAWELIKRDVRTKSPTLQALLNSVRPMDVEGRTIVLLASSEFHKTNVEQPTNRQIVEDVIKKHLGQVYAVRCTTETRNEVTDLRGLVREARKDDLVRAALNIFDAQIVAIEPLDGDGGQ